MKRIVLVGIALLATVVAASSFAATAQEDAIKAAKSWLVLVDAGEYSKSWTEASIEFGDKN